MLLIALPTVGSRLVLYDDAIYLGRPAVTGGISWSGFLFAFTSVSDLYWHPLTWLSHEVDISLFGMTPAGHHFTSAFLHAVAAGLLFLLLRRFGAGAWASAGGCLLWAIHPLRVESFAWVAERKDVLCALFFIATALAYLRYADRPSRGHYLAWTSLGALALLSKPTAVCLVPVLFLLDYWPLGRRIFDSKRLLEKLPLLILTAVVIWLTIYGQRESGSMSHLADVPLWIRLENVPVFYLRYIGKMLWPVDLACFYAYGGESAGALVVVSFLVLLALTLGAVRLRHQQPWLLVGWMWFLVCLLPNIGLLQAGRQSIADRFTNLAMIGIAISAALSLSHYVGANVRRSKIAVFSVSATIAVLALLTLRQIGYWHDSLKLFEHAIRVEDSDHMRANLALALITDKRYAEAEPHLALAVRRSPLIWDYHNNLANVLLQTGRVERAADEAAEAVRLAPESMSAAETMGLVLFRQGDYGGTLRRFNRAIELGMSKESVGVQLNDMGASVASRGKPSEAEPLVRRALELNPGLVQGWQNLALVLVDQGRLEEARATLQEAIRATGARPDYDRLLLAIGRSGR